MHCDDLDLLIEPIADGTIAPTVAQQAHLDSCAACAARLEQARDIERWLGARESDQPSASFTAAVMARVGRDQWQTERVVDIGFNLAILSGIAIILVAGAGLAWSLGLYSISLDVGTLARAASSEIEGGVINQLQTIAIAAVLLTTTLVVWYWAEATD